MRAGASGSSPRAFGSSTRGVTLALVMGAVAVGPSGAAWGAPASAADANKDKARGLAQEAIKAFEAGNHQMAIDLLAQAEQLFHAPVHLLFLARANAALGKLVEAKRIYRKLESEDLGPKPPTAWVSAKAAAPAERDELERRIPHFVVTVTPSASDVSITMNGDPLPAVDGGSAAGGGAAGGGAAGGSVAGGSVEVDPGRYTFKATASGGRSASQTVEAKERASVDVRLVLRGGEPIAPKAASSEEPKSSPVRPIGIATMALGGAGIVAGAVLAGLSVAKRSGADDAFSDCEAQYGKGHCQGKQETDVKSKDDSASLFGNLGIGLLAGGAAIAATGVVLFVVGGKPSSAPAPTSALTVTPVFSPGFTGLRGTF